jgi:acyl-[acyl-carrier-protein]-phospholipid O-acyltransferase/long-chain-fatty-acid--[acyl-carrier-protein] ligase
MSLKLTVQLMGQRRYVPIWAGQVLGAFNDNLFRYSLVTLAAYSGLTVFDLPREQMTPIAATVFTLPIFLFSAVAGQIADLVDRAKIMRAMKFAEIFLMLGAAIGFLLSDPMILLGVLFFMGVQTAFFIPARNSAMPTLLKPSELVTANALMSGAINVAILGGAILGTLFIGLTYGPPAIGVLLVVVAIIGWLAVRQSLPARPTPAPDKVRWNFSGAALQLAILTAVITGVVLIDAPWGLDWIGATAVLALVAFGPQLVKRRSADVAAISSRVKWNVLEETLRMLGFLWNAKAVLRPLVGVAWFWMMSAAVITVLPVFTRDVLGADESVVALFQLLFTIGAAGGALICGVLNRGQDALIFTVIGAAGLVGFSADLALYTAGMSQTGELKNAAAFIAESENWRILIGLFGAALSGGMFVVPLQAMAQRRADPERRGRLLAASGILNGAAGTLGPFVLFLLARADAPLQGAFWFVAGGSLIAGLFFAWRMAVNARTKPA